VKIAILLKSEPCSPEADRALQAAAAMLSQGHIVSLLLVQEAVRFCHPGMTCSNSMGLQELTQKNLEVHVLTSDAKLRGIGESYASELILEGSYESLVDLMESCDRVVGIL
jgi:sulfur relay protein TusB/DsrH